MRILSIAVVLIFLFSACGMQTPIHSANSLPSSLQTSRATEEDHTFPESKGDRSHAVIIGVIVGLVVVAGTVVPLVLLNK